MAQIKTAITVPAELLEDIDRAARDRGESRSKYISRILRAAVRARRDAEVTRRLNELFCEDQVSQAQRADARAMEDEGTSWTDERW